MKPNKPGLWWYQKENGEYGIYPVTKKTIALLNDPNVLVKTPRRFVKWLGLALPPIKKSIYVQKPKHNPPDASHEGRVYVEIQVKTGNKKLTVGTVHLSYSYKFEITSHRRKEVDNLIKILKTKK